ncbi:MAG: energy transducer TonB [Psychrobacter sp.]|uniref:energy transducer TonB n=1 Tax=Psychrobacter sp. AOP7-B1-24 TaxID=3457645 RepID=UPI003FB9D625
MKKTLPLVLLFAFMIGCQSLPQREPVIVPPTVMRSVDFTLPSQASRRMNFGESVDLILKLNINKKGTVDRASIQKSSGNRHLDRKAIIQARKMIFHAATEDGKFIESTVSLPIVYKVVEADMHR